MYGSIFRMKVRPGGEEKLVRLFQEWQRERQPQVNGAIAGFLLKPDNNPGERVGIALFENKASYVANANDPEQDRWYHRLKELLDADPQWEDGEYLARPERP